MAMRVTMTNELEIANAIFPTSQSRKVFDDLMAPVRTQMTRLLGCILSAPRVPQKVFLSGDFGDFCTSATKTGISALPYTS